MNRGLSKKCRRDFFNTLGRAFVPALLSSAASVRNGLCPVPGSPAHGRFAAFCGIECRRIGKEHVRLFNCGAYKMRKRTRLD